jgi:hypothetical protein
LFIITDREEHQTVHQRISELIANIKVLKTNKKRIEDILNESKKAVKEKKRE